MKGLKFRGRPPILISESVKDVASGKNPFAVEILDRGGHVSEELVNTVLDQSVFGWEGRHPQPALDENGRLQVTDLDLLSFLASVARRHPVIEIPRYRSRRAGVTRANEEKRLGTQYGRVSGLVSNKEVFSFSVRILDESIVVTDADGEEETGAFRSYMLVDVTGKLYDGWDRIVWKPSAEENKFLSENRLWTGNTVYFKNAVHPNRWQSIFGAPYLLLKMLVERITDEAKFYKSEMARLAAMRLTLPAGLKKPYVPTDAAEDYKKIEVETLEAALDMPQFVGEYTPVDDSVAGLVAAYNHQKWLSYTLKPRLQVVIRADELAYFLYGKTRVAPWMEGRKWNSGYKPPKARTVWEQMVLSPMMALRYRVRKDTQTVAADSD